MDTNENFVPKQLPFLFVECEDLHITLKPFPDKIFSKYKNYNNNNNKQNIFIYILYTQVLQEKKINKDVWVL